MLNKLKKPNQKGFTIIEVMIVLAIAGLILLIVFLAIPALQRNGRNTQRKNDASAVAAAIGNFVSNNAGQLPNQVSGDGSSTTNLLVKRSGSNGSEQAKLGFYTVNSSNVGAGSSGQVYINTVAAVTTPALAAAGSESASNATTNDLIIEVGENCNDTNTGAGTLNARTAAIFYVTESGTGNGNLQCVEQ